MQFSLIRLVGLSFVLTAACAQSADKQTTLIVEAGDFDRSGTPVTLVLEGDFKRDGVELLLEGKPVALQAGENGRAMFIVGQLKKGSLAKYTLQVNGGSRVKPDVQILARKQKGKVQFSQGGRSLMDYQAEPNPLPREYIKPLFVRGGYLHPIVTPSGKLVTDDYPPNHIHHHGVWGAWTKTRFADREPDFWNMGEGKGRVEFASLDDTWSGPVHGGFRAQHRYVDLTAPKPTTVLNESWEVAAYTSGSDSRYWLFDLVCQQQCASETILKLPEYRYGGIGIRGNWAWNGRDKTYFLTSEGETDREKGNATKGRWCDMSGDVDGARVGIAILGHPSNFRAPQPMRLHPNEPFFNFAPQQTGDMEIKPGEKYVARYRFVVHDGPPDRTELDRLWNDFAHPPVVRMEK